MDDSSGDSLAKAWPVPNSMTTIFWNPRTPDEDGDVIAMQVKSESDNVRCHRSDTDLIPGLGSVSNSIV